MCTCMNRLVCFQTVALRELGVANITLVRLFSCSGNSQSITKTKIKNGAILPRYRGEGTQKTQNQTYMYKFVKFILPVCIRKWRLSLKVSGLA